MKEILKSLYEVALYLKASKVVALFHKSSKIKLYFLATQLLNGGEECKTHLSSAVFFALCY